MQKIFNLMQDPYERADITSNTYWDWIINHVPSVYGLMEQVFIFAETFDKYPPRSVPPSFNPTTILEQKLLQIKAKAFIEKERKILPGNANESVDDANAKTDKKKK